MTSFDFKLPATPQESKQTRETPAVFLEDLGRELAQLAEDLRNASWPDPRLDRLLGTVVKVCK